MWRWPRDCPLARLKGATPASAAACVADKEPSSGMRATKAVALRVPMPWTCRSRWTFVERLGEREILSVMGVRQPEVYHPQSGLGRAIPGCDQQSHDALSGLPDATVQLIKDGKANMLLDWVRVTKQ